MKARFSVSEGWRRDSLFSATLPHAFTEHGAIMLASVLNSPKSIEVSLQVVRTFVRLREILASHAELSRRLEELEKRHDGRLTQVFAAVRELLGTSPPLKGSGSASGRSRLRKRTPGELPLPACVWKRAGVTSGPASGILTRFNPKQPLDRGGPP
jgi:hypothetical protein